MNNKSYHHGGLRTAMIEKGIEMIIENGAKALSLRKVAAACGVSHAAPYSHFANKEALFSAITDYITDKFTAVLKEAVQEAGETPEGLFRMGCAYVLFFARNPEYFRFIFTHSNIEIGDDREYEPYDFYRRFMQKMFDNMDYPQELRLKSFIAYWAMIQGLAAIAVMHDFTDPENVAEWEERVPDMLSNNYLILRSFTNA